MKLSFNEKACINEFIKEIHLCPRENAIAAGKNVRSIELKFAKKGILSVPFATEAGAIPAPFVKKSLNKSHVLFLKID